MPRSTHLESMQLAEDMTLYEPNPEVLQKMGQVVLYAIVGPYSSGKDSIIDWLTSHRPSQFAPVVGDTSRPPRQGEIDGVTYHFRSITEMINDMHNGRFVQVVPGFMGNFYATRPEQYPTDKIALKPIQAREMAKFKSFNMKELKWLQIVPHSHEAWLAWQADQKYTWKEETERLDEAVQSYRLSLVNRDTIFILNDEITKAAQRVLRLAEGLQVPDQTKTKQIAVRNLQELKERLDRLSQND